MASGDRATDEDDLDAVVEALRSEVVRVGVDGLAFGRLARRELHARMPDRYPPPESYPADAVPSLSMAPHKALRILQSLPDAAGTTAFFVAWCHHTFPARLR